MKKVIILVFISIFVSGCTVRYNLNYENGIYNEDANLNYDSTKYCGENLCSYYIKEFYDSNLSINYKDDMEELAVGVNLDKYSFYNKSYDNNRLNLNYSFDKDNYKYSSTVNRLFNNFIVSDNYIEANGIKKVFETYPYLNDIVISFETDRKVINSNSDEIKDNKYYWYINKDNYIDKSINIQFDNSTIVMVEDGYFTWDFIKYVLIILLIILLLSILLVYEKIKKSNN